MFHLSCERLCFVCGAQPVEVTSGYGKFQWTNEPFITALLYLLSHLAQRAEDLKPSKCLPRKDNAPSLCWEIFFVNS